MKYLFLDLETTGLSTVDDRIIEIGMVVADEYMHPIDAISIIVEMTEIDWADVIDVVNEMHSTNDLKWQTIHGPTALNPFHAEQQAVRFVDIHFPGSEQPVLCGNTVHFDRAFLKAQMPRLHDKFHYRNFDISSIKQLILAAAPDFEWPEDDEVHRAVPDCMRAISEMQGCMAIIKDSLRPHSPFARVIAGMASPSE